jgi:hypothetical protein
MAVGYWALAVGKMLQRCDSVRLLKRHPGELACPDPDESGEGLPIFLYLKSSCESAGFFFILSLSKDVSAQPFE